MKLELAYSILDIMETMQDAVKQMKISYVSGNIPEFNVLSADLHDGLTAIREVACQDAEGDAIYRLKEGCICALTALEDIKSLISRKPEEVPWKLECELLAFIEGMYLNFFYYKIVRDAPERKKELTARIIKTGGFPRLMQKPEERVYTCDLSIFVPAYNHVDYSKRCVESILSNIPKAITCELILLNHGSSDGTRAYFENIRDAHVINLPVNRIFPIAGLRALGGKYSLYVSNDIVIGKNAIENMYRAISEHEDYGWIVPSTSAVSNFQTLPAEYQNVEDFQMFAAQNNIYDETRHEARVRLCNPVTMIGTDVYHQLQLDLYEQMYFIKNVSSFPDDKISLWLRRRGYKSILEKDAYCHHFGSVTHKNDYKSQQEWGEFYLQGRKRFYRDFGIDPWGLGFCYDAVFLNRVVGEQHGHVEILGINCGLGSNSLKIKEQLKEYCHNTDANLCNITDDRSFLADLRGVSDTAMAVDAIRDFKKLLERQQYQYIIWEAPFLRKQKFKTMLECCMAALAPDGRLLIKLTEQSRAAVLKGYPRKTELGNGWVILSREECK